MKRNKIFRWLYFLILLIPIMFVFLPMINDKDNSFINTYEIITEKNIVGSHNFFDLIIREDNIITQNSKEYYVFSTYDTTIKKIIQNYIPLGGNLSFSLVDSDSDELLFSLELVTLTENSSTGVIRFETYSISKYGYFDVLPYINGAGKIVGFLFAKTDVDDAYLRNDIYFNSFGYDIDTGYESTYNFLPFYYETTYELQITNTSIWYDFSIKMNDTFPFIGDFTEFVSDNIIDISNNDYVFFAFTYMIYIFVISLLWLFFEFLMFIINFTHKFMERFYE